MTRRLAGCLLAAAAALLAAAGCSGDPSRGDLKDTMVWSLTGEAPVGVHLDVCVDLSEAEALDAELEGDLELIAAVMASLGRGDRIDVFTIHARSETFQEPVVTLAVPREASPGDRKARVAVEDGVTRLRASWPATVAAARERGMTGATDLRGMLRYLAAHRAQVEAKRHLVVLLSDMQDVEPGKWSFERAAPGEGLLDSWRQDGRIADLTGTTVLVFRCGPAHGIGNDHYRAIRAFWEGYFEAAGAKLVAYSYHRDLELLKKALG